VYIYFLENYETLKNITKIKYSITNEEKCNLITSPKEYEAYIKNNNNLYTILKDRKEFFDIDTIIEHRIKCKDTNTILKHRKECNESDAILKHFCDILEFEFIPDKSINDIINDITKLIETSYLHTKLNTNIKSDYKTEYILSLLHRHIRSLIYSQNKVIIKIKEFCDKIHNEITNNYKEAILIDEIVELLNLQDISPVSTLLKNRISKYIN
jgi:hypothetical protein